MTKTTEKFRFIGTESLEGFVEGDVYSIEYSEGEYDTIRMRVVDGGYYVIPAATFNKSFILTSTERVRKIGQVLS